MFVQNITTENQLRNHIEAHFGPEMGRLPLSSIDMDLRRRYYGKGLLSVTPEQRSFTVSFWGAMVSTYAGTSSSQTWLRRADEDLKIVRFREVFSHIANGGKPVHGRRSEYADENRLIRQLACTPRELHFVKRWLIGRYLRRTVGKH